MLKEVESASAGSRRRFLKSVFGLALGGGAMDAVAVEPEWLQVRRFRLRTGPSALRFVHFTDVHYRGDDDYFQRVVDRINGLAPDFACFTGDLIERSQHAAGAFRWIQEIRCPVFGIPGNHDYSSGACTAEFAKAFRKTGGQWLTGGFGAVIGDRVNLMGVVHPANRLPADPERFNIALVHFPAWANDLEKNRLNLILAGHSHGGQVRLPIYGALITPSYTDGYELGWYQTPAGPLYVNPGIGTFHLEVRFNCRPELTVFEV